MPEGSGTLALIERETSALPMEPCAFFQAIEFDADRSALWGAFATQAQDKENIIALQAPAPRQRIEACLFTAYLITVIFEEAGRRFGCAASETHPDSYTRLHNLVRTTASHLLDMHPATQDAFQAVIAELRTLKRAIPALADADRPVPRPRRR